MKLYKNIILKIAKATRKHPFKGLQRVLNFFIPPSQKYKIETIINDYDENLKFNIDTSSYIEWVTFFKGYYEPEVTKVIKDNTKQGDIIVDVGANVGIHTTIMAKCVGSKGRVFAFEPHPKIANRLKNNIDLNNQNQVKIIKKGLSNEKKKVDFYIHKNDRTHKGNSTFYKDHLGRNKKKIKIEVNTLDNFINNNKKIIDNLNLIKIDTEGNDFNVLLGSKKTLNKFSPDIIFKYDNESWSLAGYDFEDAFHCLNQNDYKLFKIERNGNLTAVKNKSINNSAMIYAKK